MNLRFPLRTQQLLSLIGAVCVLAGTASAQVDAALVMQDNSVRPAKVIGVSSSGTSLEVTTPDGSGRLGVPLAQIREVRMAEPAELAAAMAEYGKKNYDAALVLLKKVTDRYKGMPAAWAQQATGTLTTLHLAKGDIPAAESSLKDFQRLYPGKGSQQADVNAALIAVAKKDLDTARMKLAPIAEDALKTKNVPAANALAYSQAFFALGKLSEAEGKFDEALEQYLRTVTIFYHDRTAASGAQERADALRKEHKGLAVP